MFALLKPLAVVAFAAASVVGYHAVTSNSNGGVSVAGPVCVTHTVQPGTTVTVGANVVNNTGAAVKIDLSTNPDIGPPSGPPWPAGGHPIPRSWVGVSGPYKVGAQSTVQAVLTIHVPAGAHGRYATSVSATSYGTPPSGSGFHFGLAGAGADFLQMSVGVSPPPVAYCDNQRSRYWPYDPPAPLCKGRQAPGRLAMCRALPLVPPSVSAKNCHWTHVQWTGYIGQLVRAGERYAHNPKAYLKDAHCFVGKYILNRPGYNRSTGDYRIPDAPGQGQIQNARTTTSG